MIKKYPTPASRNNCDNDIAANTIQSNNNCYRMLHKKSSNFINALQSLAIHSTISTYFCIGFTPKTGTFPCDINFSMIFLLCATKNSPCQYDTPLSLSFRAFIGAPNKKGRAFGGPAFFAHPFQTVPGFINAVIQSCCFFFSWRSRLFPPSAIRE